MTTQDLLLRGKLDGVGADEEAERLTYKRIRAFAAATPTVYLVAQTRTREPVSPDGASFITWRRRWRLDHLRDKRPNRASGGMWPHT